MRPSFLSATLALATLAPVAGAACTDTLFLQSITVFRQSLRNSSTLGAWDSVKVNPWDSLEILKAGPVGFFGKFNIPDTSVHYLKTTYDCGVDSVSAVMATRVVNQKKMVGEDYLQVVSAEKFTKNLKVAMITNGGNGVNYQVNGALDHWSIIWSSDVFAIGKKDSAASRISYQSQGRSIIYKPTGISASAMGQYTSTTPVRAYLDGTISEFLGLTDSTVKKVGAGVDSVRTNVQLFRYEYVRAMPNVGILNKSALHTGFSVQKNSSGWNVVLPYSAQVNVVSLDGRIVRQLEPSTRAFWDGRDASGLKLHSGVWLIHAQGLGSVSVLVR